MERRTGAYIITTKALSKSADNSVSLLHSLEEKLPSRILIAGSAGTGLLHHQAQELILIWFQRMAAPRRRRGTSKIHAMISPIHSRCNLRLGEPFNDPDQVPQCGAPTARAVGMLCSRDNLAILANH